MPKPKQTDLSRGTRGLGLRGRLMGGICLLACCSFGIILAALLTLNGQKNDATVVNIAGRQRMLTQKMTKEALAIAANLNGEENRKALLATHRLFDQSLKGLMDGDVRLGLPPTTAPVVLKQMRHVAGMWEKFSTHVLTVAREPTDSPRFQTSIVALLKTNVPLLQQMNKGVGLYERVSKAKVHSLTLQLWAGGLLALLVTGVVCWLIQKLVVAPVLRVNRMAGEIEQGHLTTRLDLQQEDEVGDMARTMDRLADSLQTEVAGNLQRLAQGDLTFTVVPRSGNDKVRGALQRVCEDLNGVIADIQRASHQIDSGSSQVSDSSQALARGAIQQSEALQEISSSIADLASQTETNAEHATRADQLSKTVQAKAATGDHRMKEMVAAMADINAAGKDISLIIKAIDEIAFQTNLLALNAAVEAARAGQHGKGFAVVAEEVRNLAARSAKAAQETAELIEGSVAKAANGVQIADDMAGTLVDIVSGIDQVSELVGQITTVSQGQTQCLTAVSQGLGRVHGVTQNNTACSEESAAASEELAAQAGQLRGMLRRFRAKAGPV